ncbi:MAG TPA: glycogen debranching enzyme GlgX [Acidobacteria bacterium]|nr:glycogen debranching enzyme GlgX [Acidobacteriota bacterium]
MLSMPSLRNSLAALLLLGLALGAQTAVAQTPLGATLVSGGVQFAVFSQNATRIEVWTFSTPTSSTPLNRYTLTKTDTVNHIWTVTVSGLGAGTLYGLRAWGPNWPYNASWTAGSNIGFLSHVDANGNRFNPNKLLTDPYAKAVTGEPVRVLSGGNYHYSTAILGGTDTYGFVDSAGAMPKSIVINDASFDWTGDVRPNKAMKDSVLYEVHLRGFTKNDTSVTSTLRGTYDGFKAKASYFTDLGVTGVELLPVHEYPQWDDPVGGATADRVNYWGYMTTQFFAPNREYLCPDLASCTYTAGQQVNEFKEMVKALHAQGIEVFLDVVFNHTFEGGACSGSPVRYINLRGLDNATYYTLADNKTCYWDSTGTGNNLNASRPAVRRLIIDSLKYWNSQMGVDGFRFDLAYTLGREGSDGRVFNPNAQTLIEIAQAAQDNDFKIVAEAWDTGGYGVGEFPSGWSEWNGKWRDNVRKLVKSDASQVGGLGSSITATWSGFVAPEESVNFVTAHDGFTLRDLVSYEHKHNAANGEDNRDGTDNNLAWNGGVEGPSDDPDIIAARHRQMRNLLATLLLSQGTPMLLAGDEFGHTQLGNNNAYCQDNPIGWPDWARLEAQDGAALHRYLRRLLRLRKRHGVFRRDRFFTGEAIGPGGQKDIVWLNADGSEKRGDDWQSEPQQLAFVLDGEAGVEHLGPQGESRRDDSYLVVLHAGATETSLCAPPAALGLAWKRVFDTCASDGHGDGLILPAGSAYSLPARCVQVFQRLDVLP